MPVSPQQWSEPPDRLQLIPDTVDVWLFSLNQPSTRLDEMRRLLSQDELGKAEKFIHKTAGEQYIAAHGILRILLSRYFNNNPEHIVFNKDIYGKPLLAAHSENSSGKADSNKSLPHFNLSHSHDCGLIAISSDRAVGIDIEYQERKSEYMKIARRFFSPTEYEALQNTPEPRQKKAFLNGWCRKEAILKAVGTGISGGLGSFDVSLSSEPHNEVIKLPEQLQARVAKSTQTEWCIQNLPAVDSYTLAVAGEGDNWSLRCFSW